MKRIQRRSFMLGAAASLVAAPAAFGEEALANGISSSERRKIVAAVDDIRSTFTVPGLSMAFSKDGRLALAAAYGIADLDSAAEMTTQHRLRIGSISKTITASAIMLLFDRGKLSLDDRVFGTGGVLGARFPTAGNYLAEITIDHLLTHTVGKAWGRDPDPVFVAGTAKPADEIIVSTLEGFPLPRPPGEEYEYSNFGYLLLGRVIEEVSGQSYGAFVQENLLRPAGALGMKLVPAGDASLEDEVTYYLPGNPYTGLLAALDSVGGWTATPSDLVTFMLAIDGFKSSPDLLKRPTINIMTTPTPLDKWYARGWMVNTEYNNWWHDGSYPGTRAVAVRYNFGVNAAIMVNSRSERPDELNDALLTLCLDVAQML